MRPAPQLAQCRVPTSRSPNAKSSHGLLRRDHLAILVMRGKWSEWPDLNRRPFVPQTNALPGCATPRHGAYLVRRLRRRNPGLLGLAPAQLEATLAPQAEAIDELGKGDQLVLGPVLEASTEHFGFAHPEGLTERR